MMKTVYLMFCQDCGLPKPLSPHVLIQYIHQEAVKKIYCDNCKSENVIPEYLRKIAIDLVKEG
ncbi:hypothetical protein [Ammoniphilus sp. CFH 90114]|uniref:hypothetical protein n=1 Tax=Ammoniphilus sp. CFH 90114 TaxID=2493665 RepID=UPI00100FE8CB|nr:hypothetical protein [Ammoniphilus sp. CFH 90114]RXT07270.1 hypothetical protein EIZ39_14120 [Ammoniphilus sp. CFH 90114]